jgi:Amidohydrolase family
MTADPHARSGRRWALGPSSRAARPSSAMSPSPAVPYGLSFVLIHPRPGPFTGGHTKIGWVPGPEHAIDVATALRLYTLGTAELLVEADRLGSITPGKPADLVAYCLDPLAASPAGLTEVTPAFTIVGGGLAFDPISG